MTTDFTDHTDEERPDSISVQSVSSVVQVIAVQVFLVEIVVVQNDVVSDANGHRRTQIGRKSDDLRTQNAARRYRPKLCRLCEFGCDMKTFGRFGRKIPEHSVVASGQWLVASKQWSVARFEARPHLAGSPIRVPVQ